MTKDRYIELMGWNHGVPEPQLTEDEIALGWHFCCEFDGLLIGPGMGELKFCHCWSPAHPVYGTIKSDSYDPQR